MHTPENVTRLEDGQVFVFGSNLAGKHGGGAAKFALENFGAEYGKGEGLQGKSYAFPTLDENLCKLSDQELTFSVWNLYHACQHNPERTFLLTKVGCGIAGFEESKMKSFFHNPPKNLVLPEGW